MSKTTCKHCPTASHGDLVCDCEHSHNAHVFAAGCTVSGCDCNRYSQVEQVHAFPPVSIAGCGTSTPHQLYIRDGFIGVEPVEQ